MEILRYKLVQQEKGYVVTLYLDEHAEEFSSELGKITQEKVADLNRKVKQFVDNRFSNIKVTTVKVVVGSLVLTTIPMQKTEAHSTNFNMSYLFFGNNSTLLKQVDQTNGHLSTASPSYFDINPDGTLKITNLYNSTFVNEMHQKGIKVVPFLSNHWDRTSGRAALQNREQLSSEIAAFIETNNIDGINVDIENVTDADRDAYTDLVRLLREKIPAHKEVSVAVAANPNGWTKGWHGSYDYAALAKYADYLMIMSYDESYPGGTQGPIASLEWVEKGIQYALNVGVPSNKVVVGLPFFGRYWIDGKSYGGYGISMKSVEAIVQKYNGEIIYDEKTQSPYAIVTITSQDEPYKLGSRTLGPGTYRFYYENDQSIQKKVDLVHKYDLKGTGSWSLGQETAEIWNEFGIWLAGHQDEKVIAAVSSTGLKDIQNHWAQQEIEKIKERGWMIGVSNDKFAPEEKLTRAQAAVLLVRALNLANKNFEKHPFQDLPEGYWAEREIAIAKQHGIMNGRTDTTFDPNEPLSREEMAVMLDRILSASNVTLNDNTIHFTDISKNQWSYEAIAKMKQLGIFNGYSETKFAPKEKLTRAQMAVLLSRIGDEISPYLTVGSSSNEVLQLQDNLSQLGYLTGTSNGVFDEATASAVLKFQSDHGLTETGIAAQKTLVKISEQLSKQSSP
jgi:spore germination protein YaaH